MAIHPDNPVDLGRDLPGYLLQDFHHPGNLSLPFGGQISGSGGKKHLGGEHKAVAHHPHPFAPGQKSGKLAEKLAAEPGKIGVFGLKPLALGLFQCSAAFLFSGHLGKGGIQLAAKVFQLHLRSSIAGR